MSSFSLPWAIGVHGSIPPHPLDAMSLLEATAQHGLDCVQYGDNLPLHTLGDHDLTALEWRSRELGIDIQVGTRGIGPWLDDYAAIASRLGSPFVRVVVDQEGDHPDPEAVVERLARHEGVFRDSGTRLAIENHDRFRSVELLRIVDRLGDWVAVCIDTANSLGCAESLREVVMALGPRAINLHLKDFTIRRHPHQLGFEVVGTPAGEGMLDIPWLLSVLDRDRVDTAVLELWTPPADTTRDTIAREAEWVERSLANLRRTPGFELRPGGFGRRTPRRGGVSGAEPSANIAWSSHADADE